MIITSINGKELKDFSKEELIKECQETNERFLGYQEIFEIIRDKKVNVGDMMNIFEITCVDEDTKIRMAKHCALGEELTEQEIIKIAEYII